MMENFKTVFTLIRKKPTIYNAVEYNAAFFSMLYITGSDNKCPNGKCINTVGGYKCECQIGSSLDPTGQMCVDSRRGTCWRAINDLNQQCENNLLGLTLKSECCCSAIGAAWGSPCEKCDPLHDCGNCPSGMAMLDGKTCQVGLFKRQGPEKN